MGRLKITSVIMAGTYNGRVTFFDLEKKVYFAKK